VLPARNLFDAATAVGPPGHTLYVQRAGAEPGTVEVRSCVEEEACAAEFCLLQGDPLVPADPVVDLDTLFSPPFHLVGSPLVLGAACCGDCDGDREVNVGELVRAVANGLNSCAGSR
jgi:hypothetical protein